jgi:diguanylate cyclase (GGDEF)-like protein/hemerythrin-like metal-binding protein/PAS domain S-box-containing protein
MNSNLGQLHPDERHRMDEQSLGSILVDSRMIALAMMREGQITFANPAFHALFQSADALVGARFENLVSSGPDDGLADALSAAEQAPIRYFGTGRRSDGSSFDLELCLGPAAANGKAATIAFAWDVSEQHRAREQLAYLAYTDSLTGLANRARLTDRLHQTVRSARREVAPFALLMADLDGFKLVNDTFGHDAGDAALRLVGQRLQGCVRDNDTLARLGGDEFAVLLPQVRDSEGAALVAQRLIAAMMQPFELGSHAVSIGISIGLATWPEHAGTVDNLLLAADAAMYRAKRSGRNRFEWATGRANIETATLQPETWVAAHTVGIRVLDDEHVLLAQAIERLSAALRDGAETEHRAQLSTLLRCTASHFANEERLMQQYGLEQLAEHRQEHRRLLHDLRNLVADDAEGSISLVLRYLQEWLLRHIDGMDGQLGNALIAKGYNERAAGQCVG